MLKMVDDAGHSAKEHGTRKLLVEVSNPLRSLSISPNSTPLHAVRQMLICRLRTSFLLYDTDYA